MRRLTSLIVTTVLVWASAAHGADQPIPSPTFPGPAVGAAFPHALQAPDQTGKSRDLTSLMGSKGLMLLFVRSADWCPFCKRQLADVNQQLAQFQALGINVASVSVDTVELAAAFAAAQKIGYPMLADPKGDINLKLGIRDEQYPVGSKAFGVPRPIIYLIDRNGNIRARYMEPTYRTRPDLGKILAEAAAMRW
jgi:peroxiredoxin